MMPIDRRTQERQVVHLEEESVKLALRCAKALEEKGKLQERAQQLQDRVNRLEAGLSWERGANRVLISKIKELNRSLAEADQIRGRERSNALRLEEYEVLNRQLSSELNRLSKQLDGYENSVALRLKWQKELTNWGEFRQRLNTTYWKDRIVAPSFSAAAVGAVATQVVRAVFLPPIFVALAGVAWAGCEIGKALERDKVQEETNCLKEKLDSYARQIIEAEEGVLFEDRERWSDELKTRIDQRLKEEFRCFYT